MAMDAATQENACLWAIPGGHREPLRSKMQRNNQGCVEFITLDERPLPEDGFVPLEVPQGTLVLLHGLLPHKSEANRSGKSRYAFALHVIEGNADYGKENWLQRGPEMPLRGFESLPC
jgi:phytanoyl-CoA hydroxylase